MSLLIWTILLLGGLGLIGAVLLWATARRFRIDEDRRIDAIAALLPGANCGGCGLKGCRDFAAQCVARGSLDGIACPVGGADVMTSISKILGVESGAASDRRIAVLRCNGSCAARPQRYRYDGAESCAVMASVAVGTRGCYFGCLGCGDCVDVCRFGALHINKETGLPEVDAALCTACGACVRECPRKLLELRPAGRNNRRVWVACANAERGAVARKVCAAACIGCGKCSRVCPFAAISVNDNLAYIDPSLCRACGKCVPECPTSAILATFNVAPKVNASNPEKPRPLC